MCKCCWEETRRNVKNLRCEEGAWELKFPGGEGAGRETALPHGSGEVHTVLLVCSVVLMLLLVPADGLSPPHGWKVVLCLKLPGCKRSPGHRTILPPKPGTYCCTGARMNQSRPSGAASLPVKAPEYRLFRQGSLSKPQTLGPVGSRRNQSV
jgi:hypothetical protein